MPWLTLLAALVASPAVAQPEESDAARAREWYRAGVDLYAREEYGPALDAFRQAFQVVPRPQLRFNMARCLDRLGRHREALTELELALASPELSDEERTRARAEMLVTRRSLGTLRIQGTGAATVDDGEECALPCEVLLDPGEHTLTSGGHTRRVSIVAGEVARVTIEDEDPAEPTRGPYRPGAGTVIGASLLGLGVAGTVGFGIRTRSLEDDFARVPTAELADDGDRSRLLTNVSIALAVAGALVWLTEIIVRSRRVHQPEAEARLTIGPRGW